MPWAVRTSKFFNEISSCTTWCFGKVSVDVFYWKTAWILGKLVGRVHWTRPEMKPTTIISYSNRKKKKTQHKNIKQRNPNEKKKHRFRSLFRRALKAPIICYMSINPYFLCLSSLEYNIHGLFTAAIKLQKSSRVKILSTYSLVYSFHAVC